MGNIWHDINPGRINADDFIAVIKLKKAPKTNMNWTRKQVLSSLTAFSIPPHTILQTMVLYHAHTQMTATRWTYLYCAVKL